MLLPVGLQQDFIDHFKTRFLEYDKSSADGVNIANSLSQVIDDKHALCLSAYIDDAIDNG
jgi:hypothetical protein